MSPEIYVEVFGDSTRAGAHADIVGIRQSNDNGKSSSISAERSRDALETTTDHLERIPHYLNLSLQETVRTLESTKVRTYSEHSVDSVRTK